MVENKVASFISRHGVVAALQHWNQWAYTCKSMFIKTVGFANVAISNQ